MFSVIIAIIQVITIEYGNGVNKKYMKAVIA